MKEKFRAFMERMGWLPVDEVNSHVDGLVTDRVREAQPTMQDIAVVLVEHGSMIYKTCLCGEQLHHKTPIEKRMLWHREHVAKKVSEQWII